ncbi:MAG: hypothetical protein AAF171_09465 [Cyanobacteria bacterium P01_A01_bin.116]
MAQTITLQLPEQLHQRLVNTAQATGRPLEAVILHAIAVGSPPNCNDVPEEYQSELAMLDRLEDSVLWQIARSQKSPADMERYDQLLDQNREGQLSASEQLELLRLRQESEQFMLRKAHAASILKWRGHQVSAA